MKRIIALTIVFLIAISLRGTGEPTLAQGNSLKVPADLVEQIARDDEDIKQCLQVSFGGDALELARSLDGEQRDLNRDGKPELLIVFQRACRGAFAAGPLFVYGRTADGYAQLLSGIGRDFTVKDTVTNGYMDIQVGDAEAGRTGRSVERELTIYRFKQGQYKVSECLTEIYLGRRRGRDIYRYRRHNC